MKYSLYLARKYAAEGWWDRALRHYLTVLFTYQVSSKSVFLSFFPIVRKRLSTHFIFQNVEQREVEFAEEFRSVLESWMCYSRNADSCLSALLAPILNLFPRSVPIITLLSEHIAGKEVFLEGIGHYSLYFFLFYCAMVLLVISESGHFWPYKRRGLMEGELFQTFLTANSFQI